MGEWISVGMRPPQSIDEVWIVRYGAVRIGNYARWAGGWVRWDEQGDPYLIQGVTHWQPCCKPEPPRVEVTCHFKPPT